MNNDKIVKAIYARNYIIELVEHGNVYVINYGNSTMEATSENIKDLGVALKLFDMKVYDLEGM